MCIARNEEALGIDPHFSECYGNMANAWKVTKELKFPFFYLFMVEWLCCLDWIM